MPTDLPPDFQGTKPPQKGEIEFQIGGPGSLAGRIAATIFGIIVLGSLTFAASSALVWLGVYFLRLAGVVG